MDIRPPIDVVTTPYGAHRVDGLPRVLRDGWRTAAITKAGLPDKRTKAGRTLWADTLDFVEAEWWRNIRLD